jgi:hypothetical protein
MSGVDPPHARWVVAPNSFVEDDLVVTDSLRPITFFLEITLVSPIPPDSTDPLT